GSCRGGTRIGKARRHHRPHERGRPRPNGRGDPRPSGGPAGREETDERVAMGERPPPGESGMSGLARLRDPLARRRLLATIRPGYVVRLVISRGARSVPVPDVRGSRLSQARLILERNGFAIGDPVEVHDPALVGVVVGSWPGADAPARAGQMVKLLVSKGPA